ncbi:MAG: urease accessory protein UreD [Rhizobiaceae bacterium]|nr:urease accessory protein UreD [Rhizobiaceae bacterium]
MQRAKGRAVADFRLTAGRTRLARLHQAGCLKLRFPTVFGDVSQYAERDPGAEAILINSSGGLTGGDRLEQSFSLEAGASLSITTQACERVYRAASGEARMRTSISVGKGADLAYLPQETILFDGGALSRHIEIDCAASSRLLLVESVILGRTLMGERVRRGLFRDRWRIRRDGRLVHADDLRFDGEIERIAASTASLGGARAFSTILLQAPDVEAVLDAARALLGPAGGASVFDGLVLIRLVADDGFSLRKRLVPLLSKLAKRPLPRVWST